MHKNGIARTGSQETLVNTAENFADRSVQPSRPVTGWIIDYSLDLGPPH